MGPLMAILEGIALNPQLEASIGNVIAGIATHLLVNSNQPEAIKKMGLDLLANSGRIVAAVISSTAQAPLPSPPAPTLGQVQGMPMSPRAG